MRVAQTAPNECNCVIFNFYLLWHFLSRMTFGCNSILRPSHYITQVQCSKVVVYVWNESCMHGEERTIIFGYIQGWEIAYRGVSRKVVRGELNKCAEGPHPFYIAHALITPVMLRAHACTLLSEPRIVLQLSSRISVTLSFVWGTS